MVLDQTPAQAVTLWGDADNWPPTNRAPSYTLGTSLGEGAWPEHDLRTTPLTERGERRIWRNPDQSNGDLWYQPGRFGTILEWQPKKATGWFLAEFFRQLKQFALDMDAVRRPLVIGWGRKWREVGGTQGTHVDNGAIVIGLDGTSFEIQGMVPCSAWDIAQINGRCLAGQGVAYARLGDYRVDGISHRRPGITPHGSQGPVWKADGMLRPEHLDRFVPSLELSIVLPNTEWGPTARAVPPGWVEHPNSQPFASRMTVRIPDMGPGKVPSFTGLAVDVTNDGIDAWLRWLAVEFPGDGIDPERRRTFACNLRGWAWDASKPKTLATRIRVRESGTGGKILESTGDLADWAVRSVTPANAGQLGRGLLRFGLLTVTDGLPAQGGAA